MTDRVDVVVIGGGVVGTTILAAFSARGISSVLIEAERDVGEGASRANSAIVHTGFDARPGSLEARHLRRSATLWPEHIEGLGVPFLAVGALMLARGAMERQRLEGEVAALARSHGVATELVGRDALRERAPYLAQDVVAALSIPDEGVIDPFWLTRANAEAAMAAGATIRLACPAIALTTRPDDVEVVTGTGEVIRARQVIDAAGLQADTVARMAGDDSFAITPRKGQFLISEETFGVEQIVLPIPGAVGKGMLLTPIVFGGLLLGPTAVDQEDKDDRSTDPAEAERILSACRAMVPAVADMRPIRSFAGLRTVSSTGDYILRPSRAGDRLYLAAGIRSTGVSASPSIAETVVNEVLALRGWGDRARRRVPLRAPAATFPDTLGRIVCLCRSVSRGELEAACGRPLPPTTTDALKRRGGATFGDCQGNLCLVPVAEVLAGASDVPIESVEKGRAGSWHFRRLVAGATPAEGSGLVAADSPALPEGDLDVIVVGAGHAGRGAAAALREHEGLRILVADRRAGVDAVGLAPDGKHWLVDLNTEAGATTSRGRAVLLATGGYIEPREHRSIAGPRPSGVMTADLVDLALERGLVPGTRAVVVGGSQRASRVAADLERSGCSVIRTTDQPLGLAGDARLAAIDLEGTWIPADTLVLADRQLPQPFLLRGLGLIDDRPGIAAPVDAQGALVAPGLWAAGCCARPDVDHAGCEAEGRRVAEHLAASLRESR